MAKQAKIAAAKKELEEAVGSSSLPEAKEADPEIGMKELAGILTIAYQLGETPGGIATKFEYLLQAEQTKFMAMARLLSERLVISKRQQIE